MDLTPFGYEKRRDALIILGAGATRGASFVHGGQVHRPPVDTDFFGQLRASELGHQADGQRLLEFIEEEFGDLDISMEAFYSQVHLHDQFVADLPKGKGRRRAYEWAMKYFLRVIPPVFGCSLAGNRCAWHDALANSLNARDVILSFNYDCLIDESLRHAAKRKWLAASGYGVAATGEIGDWQDHSGYGRFPKVGLRLYKLHGSLNWRVGAGGDLELLSDPYATRPDGELCIVPPLWQKSFDAAPFRDIWLAARGVLTRVKALLVIGYSLPLTDVYTQAMLRIDVPDLDFLLIANPDSEARQRTRYILRSALRSSTRVVELDEVGDVGQLLGADAGNAGGEPGVDGLDSPHDSNGQA